MGAADIEISMNTENRNATQRKIVHNDKLFLAATLRLYKAAVLSQTEVQTQVAN